MQGSTSSMQEGSEGNHGGSGSTFCLSSQRFNQLGTSLRHCSVRTSLGKYFVEVWAAPVARDSDSTQLTPLINRPITLRPAFQSHIRHGRLLRGRNRTSRKQFRRPPHMSQQSACGDYTILERGYSISSSDRVADAFDA